MFVALLPVLSLQRVEAASLLTCSRLLQSTLPPCLRTPSCLGPYHAAPQTLQTGPRRPANTCLACRLLPRWRTSNAWHREEAAPAGKPPYLDRTLYGRRRLSAASTRWLIRARARAGTTPLASGAASLASALLSRLTLLPSSHCLRWTCPFSLVYM